jgi:hypothetical protein
MRRLLFLLLLLCPFTAKAQPFLGPVSSNAIEGSHVFCSVTCKLFTASLTNESTAGYWMIFDSASDPADGTLTTAPKYCWYWPASQSNGWSWPLGGAQFFKGVVFVYSTGADCLHKTESATAFFTAQTQ